MNRPPANKLETPLELVPLSVLVGEDRPQWEDEGDPGEVVGYHGGYF
jgi:hypothetical protein